LYSSFSYYLVIVTKLIIILVIVKVNWRQDF